MSNSNVPNDSRQEKAKARIRKLFNLAANDAATEGEIAAALEAARHLLLANQLTEDEVRADEVQDTRTPAEIAASTEYGTAQSFADSSRAPRWQGTLAVSVAEFLGTVGVYRNGNERRVSAAGFAMNDGKPVMNWMFYGPAEDCLLAAELHQELLLTCATTAKLRYGGGLVRGDARDYCDGFASGLYQAVKASQAKVARTGLLNHEGGQGGALICVRANSLIDAKRQRATTWLAESQGVKLARRGGGRGRAIGNSGAYNQGRADGASQSLSKARTPKLN